ncbi:hypothetical protein G6O67_005541 [Ophiocordyceps sinensis]|uniref:Hydrophobin 2 n=2 Tax=Ophiocordyceps sinensis TaxID=72228 RepID=A0A8H4V606_9HYPO|nr:Hydrophobin 2 [Ophiocordyceps sinensis CO18]KAF4509268.1 hypothetical protein G6O67_005541 [Ophiocordyceps sinensis]
MKFLLVAALFAGALAVPTGGGDGGGDHSPSPFCPFGGLFGNAQCCATDILGIADLDCQTPSRTPHSPSNFKTICAEKGQRARCCVLPLAGQAILCVNPVGV